MNRPAMLVLFIAALALSAPGCVGSRASVTELAEQQQAYYGDLEALLREQKARLETGLELQVQASAARRDNLERWALDLRKAEVLLAVDADVTGNQRLLSYKLAEIDLATAAISDAGRVEAERAAAILDLYDRLIRATRTLQRNSDVLIEYLGSEDEEFLLRSLDVDGVVRTIAGIRDTREELGRIEERSEQERLKEIERIRSSVDRARDLMLRVLTEDGD